MATRPRTTATVVTVLAAVTVLGALLAFLFLLGDANSGGELVDPGSSAESELPGTGDGAVAAGETDAEADRVPAVLPTAQPRLFLRVVRWPDGKPVAGAAVSVLVDDRMLVRRGRPSISGHMDVTLPPQAQLLRVAASAPNHTQAEVSVDVETGLDGVVLLELRPTRGWFGRAITQYGDPVVGAQVVARRYWPPRPAYLEMDEGDVTVTSVQAVAPATTGGPTNETGHYYVEPFDDENVVDLVLSIVNETEASERLHVPLPHVDQQLPELVAYAAAPLTGRVVDGAGYPVPRVEVQVDRGPGLDRYIEESVYTDDQGRFSVGRVFSSQHLRVQESRSWFLGGRTQGMDLQLRDGWVRVEPDAPWVTLVLDAGGAVTGSLLDAATSQPVLDGLARLHDLQGTEIASVLAESDGRFEMLLPPEWIGESVTLQLSAPGYYEWIRSTVVEPRDSVRALPEYLSPGAGTYLLSGRVHLLEHREVSRGAPVGASGQAARDVVVRAYIAQNGGPVGDWVITDSLPPEFELFWEGLTDSTGEFRFTATANLDDRLVMVSEMAAPEGALHLGSWGPRSLSEARKGIRFLQSYGQPIPVEVGGLDSDHRYLVQQTSWNPWTNSSWSGSVPFPARSEGWATLSLPTAARGAAFFDVRVDRGPVSAPVASSTGWQDLSQLEPLRVEIPEFRTVTGEIVWYSAADWPDLCLAFVGPPVPEWRSEWLGESDWCVRPEPDGRFRLQTVPPGEYTLMLYRPVGVEGVEVLAERSVTVDADLFQVGMWPDRPDSGASAYILER